VNYLSLIFVSIFESRIALICV